MKPYVEEMRESDCAYTRKDVHSKISHAKGKGLDPDEYVGTFMVPENKLFYGHQLVVKVWRDYNAELQKSNCVDFDDLLVFGVKLLRSNKKVVKWCEHVLVDEL
jgi:DNA helicase II / ATP-dependent DNA helicase PcrA